MEPASGEALRASGKREAGAARWRFFGPADAPLGLLGILAFGVFIAADDLTVVSTMLPRMLVDFEVPIPSGLKDASWIVSAYLIAYVVAMPLFGRLSDRYGRLRVYALCMALFLAGSVLVLLAPDLSTLIAARALQAFGGGGVVPIAMATVGDRFPEGRRGSAIGVLAAVDTLGWIWGPIYGSLLIRYGPEAGRWMAEALGMPAGLAAWSWQWQFALNLPLALLALVLAVRRRPAFVASSPGAPRIDWAGAVLLSGTLIALHVGIIESGGAMELGSTGIGALEGSQPLAGWPWLLLGGAGVAGLAFVEARRSDPLIPAGLFRRWNFTLAGLVNLLLGLGLITPMAQVPLLMNTLRSYGDTPEAWMGNAAILSGRVLAGLTGAMALGSLIGGWGSGRIGDRGPAALGIALAALGLLSASGWGMEEPLTRMALQMAMVGLGLGAATAAIGAAALDAAPPDGRGIASGLLLILRLMGMSAGLAGITTWGTSRFQALAAAYPLEALPSALPHITLTIIQETFRLAAMGVALAFPMAMALRRMRSDPNRPLF
ncbi:MAG: MFS transporter [Thermoflexus sp.]|uniref:MFS transporter n=1 Tax=Thermoflexus sp. TaxID=1969742 RepID=UPI0025EB3B2E|nr:MFS transporter [Thermoflexus sp.]MCS6962694.1 MFS transporter [Thermoflexus sp.]MCS7351631.1 MFS transporter [Thermoflexus sp.]MDW8181089.1 MFS transporter [Anaerolineae bacterium]MDW8184715.1 MFS transporter [Anaerolineae bacterium]